MRYLSLLFSVLVLCGLLGCGKKEPATTERSRDSVSREVTQPSDQSGDAPSNELHLAAARGSKESVESLLSRGADVNQQDPDGNTPLHLASAAGQMSAVELLVQKGADVRVQNKHRRMPHQEAVEAGNGEIVTYLSRCGAPVTIQEFAYAGSSEPLSEILDASSSAVATLDSKGRTLLHIAAERGNQGFVELLIVKRADLDARDKENGYTPLMSALQMGHADVASYLIRQGADVEARSNSGRTALMWAAENDQKELVDLLLSKEAQVNAIDGNGNTPVHLAAERGNVDTVRMLVEAGAQLELKNKWGQTALDLAEKTKQKEVVLLLKASASGMPLPQKQAPQQEIADEYQPAWGSDDEALAVLEEAKSDLKTLQTALHAYLVDYNEFPLNIHQITTPIAYMSSVPKDAFLAMQGGLDTYGYVSDGTDHFILRSVGPDMKPGPDLETVIGEMDTITAEKVNKSPWVYDPTNGVVSTGDVFFVGP